MRLISCALYLFATEAVFASEHHAINWWGLGSQYKNSPALGWLTLTFLLFIYILVRSVKKPLSLYLETRSNDIRQAIEEGQRARLESEKRLKFYEDKLRGLNEEIEKLKNSFMVQAQAEKAEKERLAKEASERIHKDTKDTIRANFERSKNRLAEEIIRTALESAQRTIMENERAPVDAYLKEQLVSDLKSAAKEVQL